MKKIKIKSYLQLLSFLIFPVLVLLEAEILLFGVHEVLTNVYIYIADGIFSVVYGYCLGMFTENEIQ